MGEGQKGAADIPETFFFCPPVRDSDSAAALSDFLSDNLDISHLSAGGMDETRTIHLLS